ncbi:MAG TPA: hypothetical protein VKR43_00020 [Bryobacteraceae bacterium]|nr:hypothetical protein [Bryobacteraceae bacterium]
MKAKIPTGMLCVCLLVPASQIVAQETPQEPAEQQAAPAQAPAPQTPTPQTPSAPPSAPGTPPVPKPTVQMPPSAQTGTPKPPVSTEHDTGGDAFSLELFGWQTRGTPTVRGGLASAVTDSGNLHFPGKTKVGEGAVVTFPTGHENNLEFTYFQVSSQGNTVLGATENFFGNDFAQGDTLATNWHIRAMKLSWNYLTYPYPSNGAKFRLKTLYEVQYVGVNSSYDSPADVNAVSTTGAKSVILPTLGLGVEYHPAKRVRLEAKASGFGLIHHGDIWDAEGAVVLRIGKVEAMAGARILHYKTSPKSEEYFSQTLGGPYVGLRWVFR